MTKLNFGRRQSHLALTILILTIFGVATWFHIYSGPSKLDPPKFPTCHIPTVQTNKIMEGSQKLRINLATVACGQLDLVTVMAKSAIIFSQDAWLHLIIFTGCETMNELHGEMTQLQKTAKMDLGLDFTFELNLIWFPNDDKIDWMRMRSMCTNQRLFLASILTHLDSVIYLDADTLVFGNLSTFWSQFQLMDDKQLIAVAPDSELQGSERYTGTIDFPFYEKNGLNGGVLMMNLTRMRLFDFERKIIDVYRQYGNLLEFADQDMINVLMHDNPNKIHLLSCIHNFYYTHCVKAESFCTAVKTSGIMILHGAGGCFRDNPRTPFLQQCVQLMAKFELKDSPTTLFQDIGKMYDSLVNPCGPMTSQMLTKNAFDYFKNLKPTVQDRTE